MFFSSNSALLNRNACWRSIFLTKGIEWILRKAIIGMLMETIVSCNEVSSVIILPVSSNRVVPPPDQRGGTERWMGVIVGPNGDVIYKHWKLWNTPGLGFSSTVYDVLDEYVTKYGQDAIFPVARTDIGNIAVTACVKEPELIRASAMKGAEIVVRYMTAGGGHYSTNPSRQRGGGIHTFGIDLQAACIQNNIHGIFVNNAVSSQEDVIFDFGAGYSTIYNPDGNIIAQASSPNETIVSATIPMATYRKKHSIPRFYKELYAYLHQEYENKYPPSSFLKSLPDRWADAGPHFENVKNW